jgi:putative PIG3 family NAD(P)H quinone oxidoreductase
MNAITVQPDGSLVWGHVPDPQPGVGEVLVQVRAAGVNRADLAQRAGHYPPPPGASEILGLEAAGEIAELGPGVTGWRVGDRVCALLAGGGYAELVSVPAALLMPIPKGWSFQEAAALPEVFFTAFLNLFLEGNLKEGEAVLIHGGASGVGTAAIQLAVAAGCTVFSTAGSPEKVAACEALGATAFNYHEEDFVEALTPHVTGVDVVLDMVGKAYLARNLAILKTGGRLIVIATLSGNRAEVDLRLLMQKRLTLKGSTLRSRPLEEKVALKEAFMARFWEGIETRRLRPVIDSTFDIRDAERAHERMRQNQNIGKLVLHIL